VDEIDVLQLPGIGPVPVDHEVQLKFLRGKSVVSEASEGLFQSALTPQSKIPAKGYTSTRHNAALLFADLSQRQPVDYRL